MSTSLSPALQELLDARVESFEKLEVLMHLRRAPEGRGTVPEIAQALDLDRDEVRAIAGQLAAGGLIIRTGDSLALSPRTGEDRAVLEELARVYEEDKIALVKAIAENAMNRLRNLAGRAFAEAFVIRKKPGGSDDR